VIWFINKKPAKITIFKAFKNIQQSTYASFHSLIFAGVISHVPAKER
jgi:hypothetical protein